MTGSRHTSPAEAFRQGAATRIVPAVLVILAVLGLTLGATVRGRDAVVDERTGPTVEELRGYTELPSLPITHAEAVEAGTADDHDWGEHCDTERRHDDTDEVLARIAIPSTYAPPCVPVWDGDRPWVSRTGETFTDNGGATANGVTGDTIRVAFYLPAEMDITRQLQHFGITDDNDEAVDMVRQLVEMNNHLHETYGRRVEVIPFHATGDGLNPTTAKADAVRVAELDVFASIGGPTQSTAYQHELARHGVLCIGCALSTTDALMLRDAPYTWEYLSTPDQILAGIMRFGTSALGDGTAEFAGDPSMRELPRRYGVVHYEQDPPLYDDVRAAAESQLSETGIDPEVVISYLLDPNSLNAQAQAIIGRLKREDVTTVVFLGDPLMPRVLTQQATRQNYFPEWIFTGTAYTDTTAIARLYDQQQLANAYGVSTAPARRTPESTEVWSLYRWWFGDDPAAPNALVRWDPVVQMLFIGIHMAGPELDATTFAGGMFRYPPTGTTSTAGKEGIELFLGGYLEGDTTPGISFGFHRDDDMPRFDAVGDFTPIWWDPDEVGPDEAGRMGSGMWQYVALGLRLPYANPDLPSDVGGDFLFRKNLSETGSDMYDLAVAAGLGDIPIARSILDEVPPLDVLPEYEPWPDSPAARSG